MPNLRLYMERATGRGPSKASFSVMGGGKSTRTYLIGKDGVDEGDDDVAHSPITSATEVYNTLVELMGNTTTYANSETLASADPRLKRVLPMADPFFQWLYCESIGNVTGIGRPSMVESSPYQILEAPCIDNVAFYPGYEFSDVTFTQRPYTLLQDDEIPIASIEWDPIEAAVTVPKPYPYEWLRFVDVETVPAGEYITAQAGQFVFDVASGLSPNSISAGSGQLRMLLKKKTIKMTWYHVPYAYVETGNTSITSYIQEGIGCINQHDWWIYPEGTLLLDGIHVVRYAPLVPKISAYGVSGATAESTTVLSSQKLCNITFLFSFWNPPLGKDLAGNSATPTVSARSQIVQAGHNLVPYAHAMQYYYVKTTNLNAAFTNAINRPIYPSFPFQLLFANPGIIA